MTREPSKGGIGIKLKIPKTTLIIIPNSKSSCKKVGKESERKALKNNARIKLLNGPMRPTHIIPFLGFVKFEGLMGTGFAYPKVKGYPAWVVISKSVMGTIIVPKGSICAKGLNVNLRDILGVGSPNL